MIVHKFNLEGLTTVPAKAKSPLIVDADAVLPGPVAGQSLQPIPRRNAQVMEINGTVQLRQFPVRDLHDVIRYTFAKPPLPGRKRGVIAE